jgi:hypothetical protein
MPWVSEVMPPPDLPDAFLPGRMKVSFVTLVMFKIELVVGDRSLNDTHVNFVDNQINLNLI